MHSILKAAFLLLILLSAETPAAAQGKTVVTKVDGQWRINDRVTYSGTAAEGLLINVRMVNSTFEDVGPAAREHLPPGFDPDGNTEAFIRRIPEYLDAGVLAFTLNLQGGMPGYEGAVNSAFEADGSLRAGYLERVARVIRACDELGAGVVLGFFYQRQHSHERALSDREAIRRATRNAARWILDEGFTNVLVEISNEFAHSGFLNWSDGEWLVSPEGQAELIRLAREAAPGLLLSTAGMGHGRLPDLVARTSDFLLIHFNNTPLEEIGNRIEALKHHGKPIVCNEDDKTGEEGARAAELSVRHGASWGFMHSAKNQYVPFEFDGENDDQEVYRMIRRLTGRQSSGGN